MKVCTKCQKEKPDSEFPRWHNWHFCAGCIKEYRRENSKSYRARNPEFIKADKKRYRQENKEKESLYHKIYQALHPEKLREYAKKYYHKNPEKQATHNQNRRARRMASGGQFTESEWLGLKKRYNHTCLRCGKREPEIKLSPDHVLPLARGGSNTIDNIQPLCRTCNNKKYTKHIDYRVTA